MVSKDPNLARQITPAGFSRAKALVRTCKMINASDVDADDFTLASDAGANAGEAELFAAIGTFYPEVVYVVTGDHRALRDVFIALPQCNMRDRLMGRVVCIEQVLRAVLNQVGYAAIAVGILAARARLSWLNPYYAVGAQDETTLRSILDRRSQRLSYDCPNLLRDL